MSVVATSLPAPHAAPRPVVHKFGGSSLATAETIRRCVNIIAEEQAGRTATRTYVVVSAARAVTDVLLELAKTAADSDDWRYGLVSLRCRLGEIAQRLLDAPSKRRFDRALLADVTRLQNILATCTTLRVSVPQTYDEIAAYGELWSMRLFSAALEAHGLSVAVLDAREFLRVDSRDGIRKIDWERSRQLFGDCESRLRQSLVIVPGYIARCPDGISTVTLGRNGSDWSATILGRLANAAGVTIWSDVPGVLEADPDVVPGARTQAVIGRAAATLLAQAGARVLHPSTLAPLHESDTPVRVRNSFEPAHGGTLILPDAELSNAIISARKIDDDLTTVTAVGPGPLLQDAVIALANSRIGYNGVQSGAGSLQVSVAAADAPRTQRVLHRALCRRQRALNMVLLGVGNVGSEVLRQLAARNPSPLRLVGVANSRAVLFDSSGLSAETAAGQLQSANATGNADALAMRLLETCEAAPVIVDATASESVADRHAAWQAQGIHIVTANKVALANGWIRPSPEDTVFYGDAATVGAGLPVLAAIRRLLAAGDTVTRIEGVLSGSLACIFHALEEGLPYSQAVLAAQRRGLAEPDARQDLSGADVARKLKIIAAAAGLPANNISQPESLFAPGAAGLSLEAFLASLPEADDAWEERIASAHGRGRVLRYVASLDSNAEATIGVRDVGRENPLAQTRGTDNCIGIYSHAYATEPLVVRGPGAGATVTARALLADVACVLSRYGR